MILTAEAISSTKFPSAWAAGSYKSAPVDEFLSQVSVTVQALMSEIDTLKSQPQATCNCEQIIPPLPTAVESSVDTTSTAVVAMLSTAQRVAQEAIDTANAQAEATIADSHHRAVQVTDEARAEAERILREAQEQAASVLQQATSELRGAELDRAAAQATVAKAHAQAREITDFAAERCSAIQSDLLTATHILNKQISTLTTSKPAELAESPITNSQDSSERFADTGTSSVSVGPVHTSWVQVPEISHGPVLKQSDPETAVDPLRAAGLSKGTVSKDFVGDVFASMMSTHPNGSPQ